MWPPNGFLYCELGSDCVCNIIREKNNNSWATPLDKNISNIPWTVATAKHDISIMFQISKKLIENISILFHICNYSEILFIPYLL
jgi:hypothetical protein